MGENEMKTKIQKAAWELFHEKGYTDTTVDEIIDRAGTSKGGFYYYFAAKDELLNSLYSMFDEEYEKYYAVMDKSLNSMLKLKQLNQYVYYFMEREVPPDWLAALYSSQLAAKRQDCFLNPERYYIRLLNEIIEEGQEKNEIRKDIPAKELAEHILLLQRGIIMDWCIRDGKISLGYFGSQKFNYYISYMENGSDT